MNRDYLYIIFIGFVSGVAFRSFFDLGISFSIFLIFAGLIIFFLYFYKNSSDRDKIFVIAFLLISSGFGMLRLDFSDFGKQDLFLENFVNQNVFVEGIILDEPDARENNLHLLVSIEKINEKEIETKKKILLIANHYPRYNYGDKINIKGSLKKPENFKTDETREFDYVSYLAKDNIYYQIFYPETKLISKGNGFFIKEKLFDFKNIFLANVRKIIPEPQSSLLGGLVVGSKESLGKDLQEDFRKVGLIHIVVLSGYNVTIIADFVMRIFSFLPWVFSTLMGSFGIVMFAIMTGASATIVRASIMALLVLLARSTGRVTDIIRSLFIAGFLMLLHNPAILVFDPSFQLSFMATLGLIVLSPKIESYFGFIPGRFQLRESVVAVISTQIFVLPLILYMMGDFSLVAVFVNLLVLVLIPWTMLFGFLAGMISFISFFVAVPFAYITYSLLSYELKVVDFFASLPFASVHIYYFPLWLMVFLYVLIFVFIQKINPVTKRG